MDGHGLGEPRGPEREERPSGLKAAIVGDQRRLAPGQGRGHGDNRPGAVLDHPPERVVGAGRRLEAEAGLAPQQDQVVALGLQEDLLGRQPHVLQKLARDPRLRAAKHKPFESLLNLQTRFVELLGIAFDLVDTGAQRDRLRPPNRRFVDDADAHEQRPMSLRPPDSQIDRGFAGG